MTGMNVTAGGMLYRHPPIVEAVFEVRPTTAVSEAALRKVSDRLARRYNNISVNPAADFQVDVTNRTLQVISQPSVFVHVSKDMSEQLTLGAKSISWVKRAPYEGWSAFYKRITDEFPDVMKALGLPTLERIGLRYVNRIDVPQSEGLCHFEDYINFYIKLDEFLDPTAGFEWKIAKPFPDLNFTALVQSAVLQPEIPGSGAFSLDIDVFRDREISKKIEDILAALVEMRDLKNKIFELGITDKARDLYKG